MDVDASAGMGEQEEAERGEEQVLEQDGEKENEQEQLEVEKKEEEQEVEAEIEVESASAGEGEVEAEATPQPAEEAPQQGLATPSVQPSAHHQHQVAGPRPAPAYRVVNAVIEKRDDGPGPRCGHTLTAVAAVNEEGSPGYIGPRLILFGGATALEGSSAAGPQAASPGAGIRLAGATADVHCYDVQSNKWTRLTPATDPPSPRAAHAATAVGTMVVIQGGIGPAGLSMDDLHVLDFTQAKPRWHRKLKLLRHWRSRFTLIRY